MTEANKYPALELIATFKILTGMTSDAEYELDAKHVAKEITALLSTQAALEAKVARLVDGLNNALEALESENTDFVRINAACNHINKTLATLNSTNKGDV